MISILESHHHNICSLQWKICLGKVFFLAREDLNNECPLETISMVSIWWRWFLVAAAGEWKQRQASSKRPSVICSDTVLLRIFVRGNNEQKIHSDQTSWRNQSQDYGAGRDLLEDSLIKYFSWVLKEESTLYDNWWKKGKKSEGWQASKSRQLRWWHRNCLYLYHTLSGPGVQCALAIPNWRTVPGTVASWWHVRAAMGLF